MSSPDISPEDRRFYAAMRLVARSAPKAYTPDGFGKDDYLCVNPKCKRFFVSGKPADFCPECAAEIQRLRDALRAMGSA